MAKKPEPKKRPVKTFGPVWTGAGRVEVAVWENVTDERTNHTVSCKRRFKVDEEYRDSQYFFPGDVLALAELLREAWAWIAEAQTSRTGEDGDGSADSVE